MSVLIRLWGGRQVYLERDRWSSRGGFVEWHAHQQEILIWVGRWHVIYTPACRSDKAGRLYDRRVAYRG